MRKLWFAHLARALVAVSRGLRHVRRAVRDPDAGADRKLERSIPVFLYGSAFWKEVVNFEALVRHGTIAAEDLQLFEFVDEPRAAFELIKSAPGCAPASPRYGSRNRAVPPTRETAAHSGRR